MAHSGEIQDDWGMSLARGVMLAVAVLVCAWFGLGVRQALDTSHATAIVNSSSKLTAAQVAHAGSLLHAAGQLNPDRLVAVLRGQLALDQGDTAHAERILRDVTAAEPLNVQAWVLLAQATQTRDRAEFVLAVRAIGRLDPRVK
jgi:predicted Zn-dependent protease